MTSRIFAVLLVATVVGNGPLLAKESSSAKVGDHLFVQLTGDLAIKYAQYCGILQKNEAPAGLDVQTTATVAQTLENGRIRIEHWAPIKRDGKQDRLLTLTATVDPANITTDVTRKGTPVYASPAAHKNGAKPSLTTEDADVLRLQLSGLKGVKLRTWTLADEIGE